MTIKELEAKTGMERGNVRYYEKEGLIEPTRQSNGYRDYSSQDLDMLLRIRLLRSLQVSIDEIKELKKGTKELGEVLRQKSGELSIASTQAAQAQVVCRRMAEDRVTFISLDAEKYLDELSDAVSGAVISGAPSTEAPKSHVAEIYRQNPKLDRETGVPHPWRRFFARSLDAALYGLLWSLVMGFVFHVNLTAKSTACQIIDILAGIVLMLILEPVWLHFFGTTPGKAVFGLHLEQEDGTRLTLAQASRRTKAVLWQGEGFLIPGYHLYRLWKSYRCEDGNLWWDAEEGYVYTIRDTKWYRAVLCIFSNLILFLLSWILICAQLLPPNRGRISVEEFAENVNYYMDYYQYPKRYRMNDDGQWEEQETYGTVYIDAFGEDNRWLIYQYETDDNGLLTSLSFLAETETDGMLVESYQKDMYLAMMAFGCAQQNVTPFGGLSFSMTAAEVVGKGFSDVDFTKNGVAFHAEVTLDGLYPDSAHAFAVTAEGQKGRLETVFEAYLLQ